MDLEKFVQKRPYLYHLTSAENFELIKEEKILYSTNKLLELANLNPNFHKKKRKGHVYITRNGKTIMLRDQQPISEKLLGKCLEDNWSCEDYFYYLNDRVFFWPTIDRLERHFKRYVSEKPIIIRLNTREVFSLNKKPKFSRLNSGATRANTYLGGIPPSRGKRTFLEVGSYNGAIGKVAEVTFETHCTFPILLHYGNSPYGEWGTI